MKKLVLLSSIALLASVGSANAAPVQYAGNGHWYDFISTGVISWDNAVSGAAGSLHNGVNGHLATVADAGEDQFISSIAGNAFGYLGAFDAGHEGIWEWITGETWSYTNWAGGEPNNCCGGENYLMKWSNNQWNDIASADSWITGYYVEYENAPSAVPVPAAVWLFGSGLLGLLGARRKSQQGIL
ncbi:lectin-like protein [Methylobacter sp. BlB1]|uniref:lectin-like protein n=1 Tax=Methylobacter sp. BlB1 TaxID=2785914 RepID=UPI001894815B|nr:lectin-like protein [Methylobacter sp. BlB1]MBF6647499.1 PEP-CTERM sorting domain-containing protein [Methylobacter sp. BlB1]